MSPSNTDIFTYGRDRARGRKRVREAVAAGDRYYVSSLGNEEETIRLGADPAKVSRIVWYVDVPPFSPEHRDPELGRTLRLAEGFADLPVAAGFRENPNLDVLVAALRASRRRSRTRG